MNIKYERMCTLYNAQCTYHLYFTVYIVHCLEGNSGSNIKYNIEMYVQNPMSI